MLKFLGGIATKSDARKTKAMSEAVTFGNHCYIFGDTFWQFLAFQNLNVVISSTSENIWGGKEGMASFCTHFVLIEIKRK
jgi:hypothetical protein